MLTRKVGIAEDIIKEKRWWFELNNSDDLENFYEIIKDITLVRIRWRGFTNFKLKSLFGLIIVEKHIPVGQSRTK